jgi:hypothetical protein
MKLYSFPHWSWPLRRPTLHENALGPFSRGGAANPTQQSGIYRIEMQ